MNEKTLGFGAIVVAAVAVLIGLAFFPNLSSNIGQMTKTFDVENTTMTFPAVNTTTELTMCGQKALTYTLTNATGGADIGAANYTISQSVGSDGYLSAKVTAKDTKFAGSRVNVTCNYEPKGYINDGGSRGLVALIAVAFALLIAVAAIPNVRNGVIDWVKGA